MIERIPIETFPCIQSVGAPPERHADRVVAEMLRQLAEARARLWPARSASISSLANEAATR